MRRAALVLALLAVAGVCGFLSYRALARGAARPDAWSRASAAARRADATKAQLPALQLRQEAIRLFQEAAQSGPASARSRAELLVGLLRIRNATATTKPDRDLLIQAAASLRRAIHLDGADDDAAYDLELLLARAKQEGLPLQQESPIGGRRARGKPGAGTAGTGY